ncbi:MAG: response regulator [Planctomycetaceae bacterium]
MRRNGRFLIDIINDILDLSKIEAGKYELTKEEFSPSALVEDVRSIMFVRAQEGGIALTVEYDGPIPDRIVSDPKRLKQILINLVGNAIKFTDRGEVRIVVSHCRDSSPSHAGRPMSSAGRGESETNGDTVCFEVIDTGIGMTRNQMQRLFHPFSQADSTVTRNFGGTGLGLAISQRLAAMLGGQISVKSESGQGSRFLLAIDAGDLSTANLIAPHQYSGETSSGKGARTSQALRCRVLVVDDRRDIRFLSKRILTQAGATVTEAEDGQDAVEQVQTMLHENRCVDLILLDMQMPRLDGYRTAEQLRRMGFTGPIIALTADAMQGDMSRCLECGCNDYLSKPIDRDEILAKVRHYVGTA